MLRRHLWLLLFTFPALLVPGELAGQEPAPALDRLVQEALQNNPDLAAALARWEAAGEQPARAGGLPDPQVGVQVIRFRDQSLPEVHGTGETWYMLTQEVPFPGKLGLRSKIARREAERAGKEYETLRLDLVEAVRAAYYDLLYAELLEEVTVANQELVDRTLGIARARYEVGSVPQQELLLARVEYSRIENQLAEFRRMRQSALAELSALLNRSVTPDFTVPLEAEPLPPATSLDLDSLTARALAQRPELESVRSMAARDTISLRLARKAYLPDLFLGVEYWVGEGKIDVFEPDERYVLDVGLTLPWIWKGKHDAAVREARAQMRASRYAFDQVANTIRREVETAAAEVQAAAEQVRNFQTSILPEATLNLQSATEGYQTDRVEFLTLVDTQRSLNELRIAYHTARVELLVAWARLDRALGNPPLTKDDGGIEPTAVGISLFDAELRR